MWFAEKCVTGVKTDGPLSSYARIPLTYFNNIFSQNGQLPAGLPRVSPTSPDLRNPTKRVFEAFGSSTNLNELLLADGLMNEIKGAFMGPTQPLNRKSQQNLIFSAATGNAADGIKWISYIQKKRNQHLVLPLVSVHY